MSRRMLPLLAGRGVAGLLVIGAIIFGCAHLVHALSSQAPDAADFGNPDMYYTLSATADVHNSSTMAVTVYRKGTTNPGSVQVNVIYEGGAKNNLLQHFQGYGHVRFNGGGAVDPAIVTLTNWVLDSSGSGYEAKITAALTDGTQSADDSNHINFMLKTTNASDIIGPDGGGQFAVIYGIHCAAAPDAINCPTHTYNLPFAPDCSVPSNGSAAVKLYDLDQGNPGIQPQNLTMQIKDMTTGAIVNNNSYSGSEGSSQTASFDFNYAAADKYKATLYNVNIQNVLQITLPFDSVNSVIDCLPSGAITSSATASCNALTGWMYDHDSPATALRYYVDVNPSGTPPATYSTTPSGSTFAGPFTANLATPSSAPALVKAAGNHGFQVNIPASVTGRNYQGPWVANDYWIYAKDATTNTYKRITNLTVNPCTVAQCPAGSGGTLSNFSPVGVGVAFNFHVGIQTGGTVTNPGSNPPGNPNFAIKVTGPGLGAGANYAAGAQPIAGNHIYSDDVSFTPPLPGTFQVTWSYYGASSNCNTRGDAGYAPYFSVQGGDIVAGPGFGAGCSASPADIKALNTGPPAYAGAGGEAATWATGTLTDFVSGLGLGGGAAPQSGSGLSFANTVGVGGGVYGGSFPPAGMPCIPNYYTGATGMPVGTTFDQAQIPSGAGVSDFTANAGKAANFTLTLGNGGTLSLPAGRTVNLYVYGNVFIKHDVTYAPYALGQAPRFNLYVAGNMYIDPGVAELHGVYVAQTGAANTGNIDTCATMPAGVLTLSQSYGNCKFPLAVVGSVMSQGKLQLTRTLGNVVAAPGAPAAPAEAFRYSPELWLTPGSSSLDTQAYTSLPPVL